MSNNTAPFSPPIIISNQDPIIINFDFVKINAFNNNIKICSICQHCIEKNQRPYCAAQDLPLAVTAEKENCPIGAW
jgi:hypothetical protein